MKKTFKIITQIIGITFIAQSAFAGTSNLSTGQFSQGDNWQVCFTGQATSNANMVCTNLAVSEISDAKNTINVQAYSFTSMPILNALAAAESRGVKVQVLLDKSDVASRYVVTSFLQGNNIPFLIDYKPNIAHNKVMIIDNSTVITGSFNFTNAAQDSNAENLIVIHDTDLAKQYTQNFVYRQSLSIPLSQYLIQKPTKKSRSNSSYF